MKRVTVQKIAHELIVFGATVKQAKLYISMIRIFTSLSNGGGDKHHILPTSIWPKYKSCQWNLIPISWGYHIALHAVLFGFFPLEQKLHRALSCTTLRRRFLTLPKDEIIYDYKTHTAAWIGRKFGTSGSTITDHLIEWGIRPRSKRESAILESEVRTTELLPTYIKLYNEGCSYKEIGKITHTDSTRIAVILREAFGQPVRTHGENLSLYYVRSRKNRFISYEKSKLLLKPLELKSCNDFLRLNKITRPSGVPSQPQAVYATEWEGWPDFLSYINPTPFPHRGGRHDEEK